MFNDIFILIMKKIKFFLSFLAIGIMLSACEFSYEEIQPVGDIKFENTGHAGVDPEPDDLPDPPDGD